MYGRKPLEAYGFSDFRSTEDGLKDQLADTWNLSAAATFLPTKSGFVILQEYFC